VKKLVLFLLIAAILTGSVFAQNRSNQGNRQRENNNVTVSGTLKLERGIVAIQGEGDNVHYVPMLNRFIGFINGLREGANVSVEGTRFRNFIQPVKVTIEGRTYDFPANSSRTPAFGNNTLDRRQRQELSSRGNQGQRRNLNHHSPRNKQSKCKCR